MANHGASVNEENHKTINYEETWMKMLESNIINTVFLSNMQTLLS